MDNLIIVDRLTISTSVYNRIDPWNLISRENAKSGVVNESGREGILSLFRVEFPSEERSENRPDKSRPPFLRAGRIQSAIYSPTVVINY